MGIGHEERPGRDPATVKGASLRQDSCQDSWQDSWQEGVALEDWETSDTETFGARTKSCSAQEEEQNRVTHSEPYYGCRSELHDS